MIPENCPKNVVKIPENCPKNVVKFFSRQFAETRKDSYIPPETCPLINGIQNHIGSTRATIEELIAFLKMSKRSKSKETERLRVKLIKKANACIRILEKSDDKLEDVREANSLLRGASFNWRFCCTEMIYYAKKPWMIKP